MIQSRANILKVTLDQDHVGSFGSNFRSHAQAHSNVGLRQRRRVVDTIAYHGHPLRLELLYLSNLGNW